MGLEVFAAAAAFIAVAAGLLAIFNTRSAGWTAEQRLASLRAAAPSQIDASGVLKRDTGLPFLRSLLAATGLAEDTAVRLQQAGLSVKPTEYFLARLLLAAAGFIVPLVLISGGAALVIAVVFCAVGFMVPALYVAYCRNRRINTINSQLAEAIQLISNSLRSGFAFTQAVELAARQLEPPISEELERFLQDTALGAPTEEALQKLARRTGSYDVEMMVTSITVQRTTGGNLSEILDNVGETIRERERLQAEIRALTASQRLTGRILSVYPIILGFVMTLLVPDLMNVLWTEEAGIVLLAIAGVLQLIGIYAINQILKLDV
jgi:tight adherence protein B